jgi:hypothetical protein
VNGRNDDDSSLHIEMIGGLSLSRYDGISYCSYIHLKYNSISFQLPHSEVDDPLQSRLLKFRFSRHLAVGSLYPLRKPGPAYYD